MPGYSWGGGVNTTSMYTDDLPYIYTPGIGMPGGRTAANGNAPLRVDSIGLAYITNGYASINYNGQGVGGTSGTSGGSFTVYANRTGGRMSVGRNNASGGTTYWSDGDSLSGQMPGSLSYSIVPTAPQYLSATPNPAVGGRIDLTWAGPSDDGGAGITGYNVYLSNGTLIASLGNVTNYAHTGLTGGTSYSYFVRARNGVSDAAGTQSVNSNTAGTTANDVPNAPTSLTATASTSVTGRVNLSWTAPSIPGTGGITGYNIFIGGSQVGSTTGTGTTFSVSGLIPYTSYNFTVRARNAFADANNTYSASSNTATATAPGPPGAPTSLTATADGLVAGKIDLAWTAPAVTGTGGITGYNIYFSTNALVTATTGTGTAYSVTGLNPGQTYSFYVTARNALADAEPSQSAASNIATAQALGEPPAPTSLTATSSTTVPGRISLAWVAPAGTITGYSVFDRNTSTNVDTLVAIVKTTSIKIDGLPSGTPKTYVVRARNSYTDTLSTGYPGNYGGPLSNAASATPNADYTLAVSTLAGALTDNTNTVFNGTYIVNAITPDTIRYAKVNANITPVATPSGTITDNTNTVFNGTYTIATPTPSTFTYAKVNADIASAAVSGGTLTNTTNASFNGTFAVSSVNSGAKTITYPRTGVAVASVAVPINALPGASSTVQNTTNTVYNGTNLTITATTLKTFSYAKTNANLAESNAAGTATDTTNRDSYNGTKIVASIPRYDTLTYASAGTPQAVTAVPTSPSGQAYRTVSPAKLDIKYRSGWAG
jgi:hypothetical protein